eukprot:COSAG03_NODE_13658_length_493_cov_4.456853_1_plen_21_part_10
MVLALLTVAALLCSRVHSAHG